MILIRFMTYVCSRFISAAARLNGSFLWCNLYFMPSRAAFKIARRVYFLVRTKPLITALFSHHLWLQHKLEHLLKWCKWI